MKKHFSVILLFVVLFFTFSALNAAPAITKTSKVEVYYFHFNRRCITCQAVETESNKALSALYPSLVKSGKIVFRSINLDDKSSKALANKCKAEGQALLVINGSKRVDMTEVGFMNAVNKPEKLKAELKKTIDALIN